MDVRKVIRDIIDVSLTLFKIMIPTLIVVKILQELGIVDLLTAVMAPAMSFIGLSADMAVVLTTTMLTNPYAGLIVFAGSPAVDGLTVGQASIAASFMLFTHSLPVEVLISRKAGVRMRVTLLVRIGGAFIFCFLLHHLLQVTGWLAAEAFVSLPQFAQSSSLLEWGIDQIKGLIFVQLVIIVLLFFLEFLRIIGVERLIRLALNPFLKFMGVGDKAATIAVVGVTLGLGFGGGLLIKEVATGQIPRKDVFGVLCFINLLHSIFEDTSVVMLLGPNLFIVLIGRTIYSMLFIYVLMRLVNGWSDNAWQRFLTNSQIPAHSPSG
ncbi:MAG: nucleoside recognition domain-containing protein [Candidatus Puniceispirillaceae bacterium]